MAAPASRDVMTAAAPTFSGEAAARAAHQLFGVRGRAEALVSERDQNFCVIASEHDRYVLKIANRAEDPAVLDLQRAALAHIAEYSPELRVPRVVTSPDGSWCGQVPDADGVIHRVWMLSYLPGQPLASAPRTPRLLHGLGADVARLGLALRGFFHPAAGRTLLWDVKHTAGLRDHLHHVDVEGRRRLAGWALDDFETQLLPVLPGLRSQVIYNDANESNVLVDATDPERLVGFIDFGDLVHTALVNDLAVAIASSVTGGERPIADAAQVVAGYHSVTPLAPEEIRLLFELWKARLLAGVLISAWRSKLHPDNVVYISADDEWSWPLLERLSNTKPADIYREFADACRASPSAARDAGALPPAADEVRESAAEPTVERRERLLGPAYELFYERPLHLVRGQGCWVFDASGRAYLDAYNNVPHVGHAHPHVVDAIGTQAARLNTNTRYLHEAILDYAERLGAYMPADLEVCMFVCTGSEANDLAWRLAKAYSGAAGAIVLDYAYHGNTDAVIQLSPSDWPGGSSPVHVKTVPAPDDLRGPHRRGESDLGGRYAASLDDAIRELEASGLSLAAFFCDTAFSCHGVLAPAPDYLGEVYARVRAAGGVCVADEVQAGFGRMGDAMWGFELYGVTPDIVTLGKPMGNGYPLAAVVTRREIAAAFGESQEYFNTFGGNPVACAAGLAVLDVLEREDLQACAARTGSYLKARLESLAARYPVIGDVRGSGLFLGVDLVRSRETFEPASQQARQVMDRMREHGVLIGRDGPAGNVLKIRPPMVFGVAEADRLTDALDEVLAEF